MNETMKVILSRRSIRAYKPEQIKKDELETILEAGRYAPSAMNQQPWRFTAVQNANLLERINDRCKEVMLTNMPAMADRVRTPGFSAFYKAPTLIVVSGDDKAMLPAVDCTLAMSCMLLAAESIGVGACWINVIAAALAGDAGRELRGALGIPEGYTVHAAAAFGYKAEPSPAAPPRREDTVVILR